MCRDLEIGFECPFCGKYHSVTVSSESWNAYGNGALAQDAFPYLTATEREQIISHLCPECQDDIFGDEDDDCDEDCENCPYCDECAGLMDYEDDVDETGFNPYEGCYDWDC